VTVADTLAEIKRVQRLPTLDEFDAALELISLCNGFDLDRWTDGILPSDTLEDAVRYRRTRRTA
jgi:hypothetical protein